MGKDPDKLDLNKALMVLEITSEIEESWRKSNWRKVEKSKSIHNDFCVMDLISWSETNNQKHKVTRDFIFR